MTASLYQSCWLASCWASSGDGAFMPGSRGTGATARTATGWDQAEAIAGHQVLDGDRGAVGQLPFPQRDLEAGLLDVVRVEADDGEDHVLVAGQRLAIGHHLVVARAVEAH